MNLPFSSKIEIPVKQFASCEVPLRNEISLLCDTKLCMHHCIDMPMSSALALALQYFS